MAKPTLILTPLRREPTPTSQQALPRTARMRDLRSPLSALLRGLPTFYRYFFVNLSIFCCGGHGGGGFHGGGGCHGGGGGGCSGGGITAKSCSRSCQSVQGICSASAIISESMVVALAWAAAVAAGVAWRRWHRRRNRSVYCSTLMRCVCMNHVQLSSFAGITP